MFFGLFLFFVSNKGLTFASFNHERTKDNKIDLGG